MKQAKKNMEVSLLGATPFLELFGHAEVGKLLAQSALIAHEKLNNIYSDKGAETDAAKKEILNQSSEAAFYDSKIKTALFFANYQLPHCKALSKSITSTDSSALDIIF